MMERSGADVTGSRELGLTGQIVNQLVFGWQLGLVVETGAGKVLITIEVQTELEHGRESVLIDPAGDPTSLSPMLKLLGRAIQGSVAYADGTLELTFVGDFRLLTSPSASFEAWNVAGPGTNKIVCMPGGGLAIWKP